MTFLCLLLVPELAFGQASCPASCRVANEAPGWCTWAALETLARMEGFRPLYGLKAARKKDGPERLYGLRPDGQYEPHDEPNYAGNPTIVRLKLRSLGLLSHLRQQEYGVMDKTLIFDAIRRHKGCVVGVSVPGVSQNIGHVIVVLDLNDRYVEYYDPNEVTEIRRGTRRSFDSQFDGWVMVLEP